MALTWTVSKVSTSGQDKIWNIALNFTLLDDAVEVVNQNISIQYREGQDIDLKRVEALEKMQNLIDKYKAEQVIFTHAKMDALVIYLDGALVA